MRNLLLAYVLAILIVCPSINASSSSGVPNLDLLQLVTQVPPNIPQRITGLAYDGERFWATIYHGNGHFVTIDPTTLLWTISNDEKQHQIIRDVVGRFQSPGGISVVKDRLWVTGSYGESFGSVDLRDWKIERVFPKKHREDDAASQSYSSIVYDGTNVWIAWHWSRYNRPRSQTQLLLKIEPETGKVVAEYPLPPGTASDLTHGLTWDGSTLWHAKDKRLSAIDPATGNETAAYILPQLKRPSGLAWDGQALWIVEFDGKLWRLPFQLG